MNAPQRPTINRSTRIVESATDKGYVPSTAPEATINVDLLAKGVAMAMTGPLTPEQTTRIRAIIATTPDFPCDFRHFMFIVQGWDMTISEEHS